MTSKLCIARWKLIVYFNGCIKILLYIHSHYIIFTFNEHTNAETKALHLTIYQCISSYQFPNRLKEPKRKPKTQEHHVTNFHKYTTDEVVVIQTITASLFSHIDKRYSRTNNIETEAMYGCKLGGKVGGKLKPFPSLGKA